MDELTEILSKATRAIDAMYFQLNIDGGDPVFRERVYCYELYHQMRSIWPANSPFYLNGEIDKSAHPILSELGAAHAKPDLLVHRPGYMTGNFAIIEVKSPRASLKEIAVDLEKLALFVNRVGYRRAIYLHYGSEDDAVVTRVQKMASIINALPAIEVWRHAAVGKSAEMMLRLKGKN